jgi:excisionase family DNA binding protein
MEQHLPQTSPGHEKPPDIAFAREELPRTIRVPKASRTLIDINELSRRLSIAKGTLYNWVYLRRIPYIKAGRCLRFDPDTVFESLRQCPTINEAGRR